MLEVWVRLDLCDRMLFILNIYERIMNAAEILKPYRIIEQSGGMKQESKILFNNHLVGVVEVNPKLTIYDIDSLAQMVFHQYKNNLADLGINPGLGVFKKYQDTYYGSREMLGAGVSFKVRVMYDQGVPHYLQAVTNFPPDKVTGFGIDWINDFYLENFVTHASSDPTIDWLNDNRLSSVLMPRRNMQSLVSRDTPLYAGYVGLASDKFDDLVRDFDRHLQKDGLFPLMIIDQNRLLYEMVQYDNGSDGGLGDTFWHFTAQACKMISNRDALECAGIGFEREDDVWVSQFETEVGTFMPHALLAVKMIESFQQVCESKDVVMRRDRGNIRKVELMKKMNGWVV